MRNAVASLVLLAVVITSTGARADPIGLAEPPGGSVVHDLTLGQGFMGLFFAPVEAAALPLIAGAVPAAPAATPVQGFMPPGLGGTPPGRAAAPPPAQGPRAVSASVPGLAPEPGGGPASAAFMVEAAAVNAMAHVAVAGEIVSFGPMQPAFIAPILNVSADPMATPEPATLLLLGTGLAGLAAARRRMRQAPPA